MASQQDIHSFLAQDISCSYKHLPVSNSVSIGVYVDVSLKNETDAQMGMSHFLEHMCFRGTKPQQKLHERVYYYHSSFVLKRRE